MAAIAPPPSPVFAWPKRPFVCWVLLEEFPKSPPELLEEAPNNPPAGLLSVEELPNNPPVEEGGFENKPPEFACGAVFVELPPNKPPVAGGADVLPNKPPVAGLAPNKPPEAFEVVLAAPELVNKPPPVVFVLLPNKPPEGAAGLLLAVPNVPVVELPVALFPPAEEFPNKPPVRPVAGLFDELPNKPVLAELAVVLEFPNKPPFEG